MPSAVALFGTHAQADQPQAGLAPGSHVAGRLGAQLAGADRDVVPRSQSYFPDADQTCARAPGVVLLSTMHLCTIWTPSDTSVAVGHRRTTNTPHSCVGRDWPQVAVLNDPARLQPARAL